MKALDRSLCWCPNIDADIEDSVNSCEIYHVTQNIQKTIVHRTWPNSLNNWERVHIDFCEIYKQQLLLIFNTKSKWLDAYIVNSTNAEKIIKKLKFSFVIFGLPAILVSDNGSAFNSVELNKFCQTNKIIPVKSPPYHSKSKGSAETGLQTIKSRIKKNNCCS